MSVHFKLWFLAIGVFAIVQCSTELPERSEDYLKGEAAAKTYCIGCHQYVEPEMLDKGSWLSVLNSMKYEMGQSGYEIPYKEWISIQQFYRNHSPLVLPSATLKKPAFADAFEKPVDLDLLSGNISLLKSEDDYLYVGNLSGEIRIDSLGHTLLKKRISSAVPIDMVEFDDSFLLLNAGNLMPSNAPSGSLIKLSKEKEQRLVTDIIRPVHLASSHSDDNGTTLLAVSSFGSVLDTVNSGSLIIYQAKEEGIQQLWSYDSPGATKSIFADVDKDGDQDILALFSQGNERICLFEQVSQGVFTEKILIQHSPVWGTNDFLYEDLDGDGVEEIITANGDNGDGSQIFKPYHGIRIYTSGSAGKFELSTFIPLNGVSKLITTDVDDDADLDLLVVSMYPNLYTQPWQSLVLLKQTSPLKFDMSYLEESASNQWLLATIRERPTVGTSALIVGANRIIDAQIPPKMNEDWKGKDPLKTFEIKRLR